MADPLNPSEKSPMQRAVEAPENERTFGELLKEFKESNVAKESEQTIDKIKGVLEALPDEIEEIATAPLDKVQEILSTEGVSNEDIRDLQDILGNFNEQVQENNDIDKETKEKIGALIEASNRRLEMQIEGFGAKFTRTVSENFKAATGFLAEKVSGLTMSVAGAIGGDSPLVANLTNFVTGRGKEAIEGTKRFVQERKERKEAREQRKQEIEASLNLEELQQKQAQRQQERDEQLQETRTEFISSNEDQTDILKEVQTDTRLIRDVVVGEVSDVQVEAPELETPTVDVEVPEFETPAVDVEVPEVETPTVEVDAQTDSTEQLTPRDDGGVASESMIQSISTQRETDTQLNEKQIDQQILEAIRNGDIEQVELLQQQKETIKEQTEDQRLREEQKQQTQLEVTKESENRQERLIQAIEGVSGAEGVDVEDDKLNLSNALLGLVGFVTAFISGFATEVKKQLSLVFRPIIRAFKNSKLGKLVSNVFSSIRTFFGNIVAKFKGSKLGSFIDDIFKNISKSPIGKLFTKIGDTFKKLGKFVKPLFGSADDVAGIAGKFMRVGKVLGSTLGKFFLPITVLLATIDTVKGFIQGFREGGLVEGVKGALEGLFSSLVGTPLNLLKDLVGWVAGKLGFENVQERLAAFDFNELYSKFVDAGFAFYGKLGESIIGAFNKLKTFFVDTFTNFDLSETLESISGVINRLFTALKDATVGKVKEIGANIPLVGRFFGGGDDSESDIQPQTEAMPRPTFGQMEDVGTQPQVEVSEELVKQQNLQRTMQMESQFNESRVMGENAQLEATKKGATTDVVAPITSNQNITNSASSVVVQRDVRNQTIAEF